MKGPPCTPSRRARRKSTRAPRRVFRPLRAAAPRPRDSSSAFSSKFLLFSIFCIGRVASLVSGGGRMALAGGVVGFLRGGQEGVQGVAFHAGNELNKPRVADIENQAVDDLVAEVAMGHLAALEAERRLHLVAFS